MASMQASSDNEGEVPDLPLEQIVFSCSVCQATASELYARTESNKGFNSGDSGDSGDEGIVVKLWIAQCSHILCNKHLPGGGRFAVIKYGRASADDRGSTSLSPWGPAATGALSCVFEPR